jgi:site-specific recombinase XerD
VVLKEPFGHDLKTSKVFDMRSLNTFAIQFILRANKAKDGAAPIYVRIVVNTSRCECSLRRSVDLKDWSKSRGMAKPKTTELKLLNNYLEEVRAQLTECYRELRLKKKVLTAELIKSLWLGTEEEYTLNTLIQYHNVQMKDVLAAGTLKNYFTTARYLQTFVRARYKRKDIYLSELNYRFITEFEMFLRQHVPEDHQKKLENNGVMKHLERMRKMVKLAVRLEWLQRDPLESYKLRFTKVERECLTKAELLAIEKKIFSIERLQWAQDLFIFSCYTGLAYTDVMQLTSSNIIIGIDGKHWIKTQRQKTDIAVAVPLLPTSFAIINKYKNDVRATIKGTLFPTISNQKLNSYLKEIADICGITKRFTYHLARHTFATTVTLSNGVPIETVSKMLGHTKITTTQIYAKVVEKKIGEDMDVLQKKLSAEVS